MRDMGPKRKDIKGPEAQPQPQFIPGGGAPPEPEPQKEEESE